MFLERSFLIYTSNNYRSLHTIIIIFIIVIIVIIIIVITLSEIL